MEREQILERYADVLAAESTKEAFVLDGALYYRYEWLNEVEMMPEIVYYRLDGEEEPGSQGGDRSLGQVLQGPEERRESQVGKRAARLCGGTRRAACRVMRPAEAR